MEKNGIYNVAFDNSSEQTVTWIHNRSYFVVSQCSIWSKFPSGFKTPNHLWFVWIALEITNYSVIKNSFSPNQLFKCTWTTKWFMTEADFTAFSHINCVKHVISSADDQLTSRYVYFWAFRFRDLSLDSFILPWLTMGTSKCALLEMVFLYHPKLLFLSTVKCLSYE